MNLIIGGSSGLGRSLTRCFADSEKTYVISRRDLVEKNGNVEHIKIDINENLENLYDKIKEHELSSIFFTVGLIDWKEDDLNLDLEKNQKIFETNFLSIKKIISDLIKKKKLKRDCLICFCSSVSTILPRHKQIAYCAAKSALNSFYKSLSAYLYVNNYNYRLVNLMLGYMDTEMNKDIRVPFKKVDPDKIARFIYKKRKTLIGTYYIPKY
jgi:NAD(P)-dependent dehydrogenase (short-subunit alcohol dehydrogenase family)